MDKLQWKVCGMREEGNIKEALKLKPSFMGFIFYKKSPRYAGLTLSAELLQSFPETTQKVGVFVNESRVDIQKIVAKYHLDAVQLHGQESPNDCFFLKNTGVTVIKAFSVAEVFDFNILKPYEEAVDIFLFDTKGKSGYGGHGYSFDWDILQAYDSRKPFLLAGGVDLASVNTIERLKNLPLLGIDINSRFEVEPGFKDISLLQKLSKNLNS